MDHLAELFGITDEDIYVKAEKVADSVLADLYKPEYVSAELIEKSHMLRASSAGKNSVSCQAVQKQKFSKVWLNVPQT